LLSDRNEEHKQNAGQRYLWQCWKHFAGIVKNADLVAINADIIDGKQYKSKGTGIITSDMSEQAEIAEECLETFFDICKPKKIIRTSGSNYHEGFDGALKHLDEHFEIPKCRVGTHGQPFDIELEDGIILNIKHTPEGSAALYLATVQDRETIWATIAETRQGLPEAHILVRSHLHTSSRFEGCGKRHILTPAWQLQTPYASIKRYYRWQPCIGGIVLQHEPIDDLKYITCKKTYKLPKRRAVPYEHL
jgi:hypothetical protein